MFRITLILISIIFSFTEKETSPAACEVKLEAISGQYEGDCKKGLAHGEGEASGVDSYKGEFKKGLPHGAGTYRWSNGDVYEGAFKGGQKDGEGKLVHANGDPTLVGFWAEDEYIGTDKNPYKIINKPPSVNRITFKRKAAEPNQITMRYTRLGKPAKSRNLRIEGSFGVIASENDFSQVITVYSYPIQQGNLSFSVLTTRDAGGAGGGEYIDGSFEFSISQSGSWEITVEMLGND